MTSRILSVLALSFVVGCSGKPPQPGEAKSGTATPVVNNPTPPVNPGAAVAAGDEKKQLVYSLTRADAAYREGGMGARQFQSAILAVKHLLPEVTPSKPGEALKWKAVEQTPGGAQLSAVRFRSTLDKPADMHWMFVVPEGRGRWYIFPVEGTMTGFNSFDQGFNLEIEGVQLPPGNLVTFQSLTGGQIQPGQEYILWFSAAEPQPADMQIAIQLSPAGAISGEAGRSRDAVSRAMGVTPRPMTFPATDEGIKDAFTAAHRSLANQGAETPWLRETLRSLAPALPEVSVSTQTGKPAWTRLEPAASLQFHAVRLRSGLDVDADLHWVMRAGGDLPQFGIAAPDEDWNTPDQFTLEVDLPSGESSDSAESITMLQAVRGGMLKPGKDVVLWFSANRGILPQIDIALTASPEADVPAKESAQDIARLIGIDVPATPAAPRVEAALRRCRSLVDDQRTDSAEFLRLLEFALPGIPLLALSQEKPVWNPLVLNKGKIPFAAFRIDAPGGDLTDLFLAVLKNPLPKSRWQIADPARNRHLSATRMNKPDVSIEGAPAAPLGVFDSVLGGQIREASPLVLWFAPEDKEQEFTVQAAARFGQSGKRPAPQSARAAADALGMTLTLPPAPPGCRFLQGHTDTVTKAVFCPDGIHFVTGSADGTVRVWETATAELKHTFSNDLGEVTGLTVSSDGSRIAAAFKAKGTIIVWDRRTYETIQTKSLQNAVVTDLSLSSDGAWLTACDSGVEARQLVREPTSVVWEVGGDAEPLPLSQSDALYSVVRLTPDATTIIGGAWVGRSQGKLSSTLQFIDRKTMTVQKEFRDDRGGWHSFALTQDGKRLVASRASTLFEVWDVPEQKRTGVVGAGGFNTRLSTTPDGKQFVSAAAEIGVELWDAESLRIRRVWHDRKSADFEAAISPDAHWIVFGDAAGNLHLQDTTAAGNEIAGELMDPLKNSLGMTMMPIPNGEFDMGTFRPADAAPPERDENPEEFPMHHVTISKPFYISAHEVTVAQFRAFQEATGYQTTAEKNHSGTHWYPQGRWFEPRADLNWRTPGFEQSDDHPVGQVSWLDCVEYCKWLSKIEKGTYRLPTEAEWEYACRGGSIAAFSFGILASSQALMNVADFALKEHHPSMVAIGTWNDGAAYSSRVGSYVPNPFGLYDMHGNALEWCSDWYDPVYYNYSEGVDPKGPKQGKTRVQRGGSFMVHPLTSRSAKRDLGEPTQTQSHLGFRVVLEMK
jgi:formylglycine-generating enzyme required for sulfatase activity